MTASALDVDTSRRIQRWRSHTVAALWVLLAVALAFAWLSFPYLLNGRRLLGDVGFSLQAERMTRSAEAARLLIRSADGPGNADVDVLYATPEYLDLIDPSGAARKYEPRRYLVFFVTETAHVGALPAQPPEATLIVDGRNVPSADVNGPHDVEHHRASVIRFLRDDIRGLAEAKHLEIRLESTWNRGRPSFRAASWGLPIVLPPSASTAGLWSFALVLSLSAGLLSAVLTPCLLQLVVVYLAALIGVGDQGTTRARGTKRMINFAIWFVLGFTVVYALAGALIGQLGHQSQLLFATINRPAGIASGAVIILLALGTAHASHTSVACRLPMPGLLDRIDQAGSVRAAAMAVAFSVGCITCFGGAIVGTLLLYVGSVGSALIGAAIMLTFSAGVAIPFVAAALALTRAVNVGERLARIRPWAAFVSSVVMAAFGIVLITDNFHALSDWIYPYLHLPLQR